MLEFMLGGNPGEADRSLLTLKVAEQGGTPCLTVSVEQWRQPGYRLSASHSSDLALWQSIAPQEVTPISPEVNAVRYVIPLEGQAGFIRFMVETPPSFSASVAR